MGETNELGGRQHAPTLPAFERLERSIKVWKMLAGVLSVVVIVYPALASVWILGENSRAVDRWESQQFRDAIERQVGRMFDDRSLAAAGDLRRLEVKIEEQAGQLRVLQSSVDRLVGYMEAQRQRGSGP